MRDWRLRLVLVAALAGSGLVLSAQNDLDALSNQDLAEALEAELDDLFDELGLDEDAQYQNKELFDAIMYALSDKGDDDDDESLITMAGLQAEMAEVRTTVQAVVDGAVQEADQMSLRQDSPSGKIVLARFSGYPSSFALRNAGLDPRAQRGNQRGWAVAGVAKKQTSGRVFNASRSR